MKVKTMMVIAFAVFLTRNLDGQTVNKHRINATSSLGKGATFEYIQGKLRSLTPEDGSNDFKAASFDEPTCAVRLEHKSEDWKYSFNFGDLDINNTRWSIFDPNPKGESSRALIVMLRLYTSKGLSLVDESLDGKTRKTNTVTLLFSLPKAAEIPNLQTKMSKAVKHLVSLCSGQSETEPF